MTRRAPHPIRRVAVRLAAVGLLALAALGPATTPAPRGRRPDDDRPGPAPGTRPARLVDRDRGPPRQRGPVDQRRDPAPGRQPGRDPLRDRGPARQPVRQDVDPPRPAAVVRPAARGRPRQRRARSSLRQKVAVTIHDPASSSSASSPRTRRRIVGNLSLPAVQNQQPAVVVPLTVADLPTRIEAWSALDRLVWQDVDASTLSTRAARRDARLARPRRAARDRRRDRRDRRARRLPGRHPAVPPELDGRRPGRVPRVAARHAAGGRERRSRRWPASSSAAGSSPRAATASSPPRRSYGSGHRDVLGIDPTRRLDRRGRRRAGRSGRRLIPARSEGTVGDDRRQPDRQRRRATCRRWPCRRSAGCSCCCSATSP